MAWACPGVPLLRKARLRTWACDSCYSSTLWMRGQRIEKHWICQISLIINGVVRIFFGFVWSFVDFTIRSCQNAYKTNEIPTHPKSIQTNPIILKENPTNPKCFN